MLCKNYLIPMFITIENSDKQFEIDDIDKHLFDRLECYKFWFNDRNETCIYTDSKLLGRGVSVGRIILGLVHKSTRIEVDHRDRNILNYKRSNLRTATRSQNASNKEKQKGIYSSIYKGVYWHKSRQRWMARISYDSKTVWLGYFDDEDDAAIAYNLASMKYHGEFAVLNTVNINLMIS